MEIKFKENKKQQCKPEEKNYNYQKKCFNIFLSNLKEKEQPNFEPKILKQNLFKCILLGEKIINRFQFIVLCDKYLKKKQKQVTFNEFVKIISEIPEPPTILEQQQELITSLRYFQDENKKGFINLQKFQKTLLEFGDILDKHEFNQFIDNQQKNEISIEELAKILSLEDNLSK